MNFWTAISFSFITISLLMAVGWWVATRINNYSIVDAIWALSFACLVPLLIAQTPGLLERKLLLGLCYFVWSIRLGTYLSKRIFSHLDQEDGRYQTLRAEYGKNLKGRFFIFFQLQALSVVLFILPLLLAAQNSDPLIHPIEYLAVGIFILGWGGEMLSDYQLSAFKRDGKNREKVCVAGLWYYSRHPNYFFESVLWFGLSLFALPSPYGLAGLLAFASMLFLLLKVTGVPMSEAQNLKSKPEGYKRYQATTSIFIPLPKRD